MSETCPSARNRYFVKRDCLVTGQCSSSPSGAATWQQAHHTKSAATTAAKNSHLTNLTLSHRCSTWACGCARSPLCAATRAASSSSPRRGNSILMKPFQRTPSAGARRTRHRTPYLHQYQPSSCLNIVCRSYALRCLQQPSASCIAPFSLLAFTGPIRCQENA